MQKALHLKSHSCHCQQNHLFSGPIMRSLHGQKVPKSTLLLKFNHLVRPADKSFNLQIHFWVLEKLPWMLDTYCTKDWLLTMLTLNSALCYSTVWHQSLSWQMQVIKWQGMFSVNWWSPKFCRTLQDIFIRKTAYACLTVMLWCGFKFLNTQNTLGLTY